MKDLGLHRFEQRRTTILAILDHVGYVELVDSGRGGRGRRLRFETRAPGPLPRAEASFIYAEWYQRVARGWRLSRYQYDYLDRRHGGRLGYHWHSIARRNPIYHAHCEHDRRTPPVAHYRSYEIDLLEAHEEFAKLYAADAAIDCGELRPLI